MIPGTILSSAHETHCQCCQLRFLVVLLYVSVSVSGKMRTRGVPASCARINSMRQYRCTINSTKIHDVAWYVWVGRGRKLRYVHEQKIRTSTRT